ncbi:hypothetical protein KSP35_11195 [Aquihabitans sp. G128]|uniref:SbcC/MukB-like Walker B domain-containing protein n=1 Tax=Aquihabitans sp. G128 TaxID=2849779 RepID=UPI001C232FA3|nr:SbcC/MukB-like Walker B domain-containing protein [Aquihabitans sp. G128]QXC63295.1 hypothetical protein KSP35_11195 [Aquihabitans sp. G128]
MDKARLLAEEADVAAARVALARAEQADQIRPSLTEVERRAKALRAAATASTRDRAQAGRAVAALARPVAALSGLPADLADEAALATPALAAARQALATELAALDALGETAEQVAAARRTAEEHRARARRDTDLAAKAAHRVATVREELAALADQVATATSAQDRLPGLAEAARQAAERASAAERLVAVREQVAAADEARRRASDEANAAWSGWLDLRERYLNGIAAELASELEPGVGCQVCGATEHPRPAEPAPGSTTRAEVDAAEQATEAANQRAAGHLEATVALQRTEAELSTLAGPGATDATAARATAAVAAASHRAGVEQAAALPRLLAKRDERTEELARVEQLAAQVEGQIESAKAAAEAQEHAAAATAARLEAALGSAELPAAIAAARRLDDALVALARHATVRDEAALAKDQAAERLATDLAASPFGDAAEARAALLDADRRRSLATRIDAHDRQLMGVQDALGDPLLAGLPAERPDVEAARAAAAAAQQASQRAVARRTKVHAAHERIDELARQHGELLALLLPQESDANLHEAVAARCAGRANPKVSLQRWVLATYLEAICVHANQRLATMTAGRYQLRVERESLHAAAKAGLDLWVHDAHTGTTRPVSSLSGGETFQASLALALGVADSVEARTGGVRLDALFVDEGFGSLDPESLQLAMDELDGLREGGRLVGCISHVGALRERIRVGIEVTRTDAGSTVRVGDIAAA